MKNTFSTLSSAFVAFGFLVTVAGCSGSATQAESTTGPSETSSYLGPVVNSDGDVGSISPFDIENTVKLCDEDLPVGLHIDPVFINAEATFGSGQSPLFPMRIVTGDEGDPGGDPTLQTKLNFSITSHLENIVGVQWQMDFFIPSEFDDVPVASFSAAPGAAFMDFNPMGLTVGTFQDTVGIWDVESVKSGIPYTVQNKLIVAMICRAEFAVNNADGSIETVAVRSDRFYFQVTPH